MKYLCCTLFAVLILQNTVFAQNKKLQKDLDQMLEWFAGDFNNFWQVQEEKDDSLAQDLRHEHIHSIFRRADIPALGKHIFFVKQYFDNDENKVYRQRVYRFGLNKTEKAIQLEILSFANADDEKKYAMAYKDPAALKDLKADAFKPAPGCEVYWKRDGDRYIGYMKKGACNFVSKRSGKKVFIMDSLQLTRDEIWIRDEATDENGQYVFGNKAHIHHKLKRCHYFKGWAAVRKPDSDKNYDGIYNLRLHDQGHRLRLSLPDGTLTPYTVELAQVIYGKKPKLTPVLKLAVYEEGNEKSLAYVWASPNAKNIGINMRILQAGFTAE